MTIPTRERRPLANCEAPHSETPHAEDAHSEDPYAEEPHAADPRTAGPQPPYPPQCQEFPGQEEQLRPLADHGEASYRGSGKLTGKVALITGADSGIGRAVALAFAREGADVVIAYFSENADAERTKSLVEEAGRRALTRVGNIANEKYCQTLVEQTIKEFGRLDILVNNAAYQMTFEHLTDIPAQEFEHTFQVNVYGMFYLCKAAVPYMAAGSSIINTASIQAYHPAPTLLPYAATQGAVVTFTKGLAHLVIKQGIRVNAVAPGPVWTPLIPYSMPSETVKSFGETTPIGRAAQPAELAPLYVFLASEQASYITGMVYGVTGGKLMI